MTQEEYNLLVEKNREHKVFDSDWSNYYSIDFADTLLPEIPLYKGKGLWTFDGAELFAGSQKTESRVLDIDNSGTLINLIAYIYPKDVKAAERKQFVQAAKSEVCLFAEVAQDDSIELSFKFGKRFKDYLKNLAANGVKAPTPTDVESKTYATNIADFRAFFDNQLVHEDLMRFVLETVGLEMDFESNLRSKLVLFFRSEMQAKGLPKGNTSKPIIDDEYDGSFGFDIFSPKLYGYNTAVYKAERDSTGNEKMIESGKTLEDYYEKDELLKTELENTKRRTFYIDDNYEFTNKRINDTAYYIPNILLKRDKEVQVFLKYFNCENNKGIEVFLSLSAKKGIEDFTRTLSFKNARNRNILPITIKTSADEYIKEKTTLTVAYDENGETKVIGKLNILPNTEINPKFIFTNVFFTQGEASEISTNNDNSGYKSLIDELNKKAFNQSCVNIHYCSTKRFEIGYSNTVINKQGTKNNSKTLRSLIDLKNFAVDLDKILYTLNYYFYRELAQAIFNEIEQGLQKVTFTLNGEKVPLIPTEKTLEQLMDMNSVEGESVYEKCVDYLTSYLSRDMKLNVFVAFMCQGLKVNGSPTAVGAIGGSGLIVPEFLVKEGEEENTPTSNFDSTMLIAHEIGHNFNLRHPFDVGEDKGDLKLHQGQTLENYMDYDIPKRKSFWYWQWKEMQKNVKLLEEVEIKQCSD